MKDKLEIKVCKDIFKYRESIVMGLTLRQVICSVFAILIAVGLFLLLQNIIGRETASWVCIVGASPFAVAGFFSYNGLTIEKFVMEVISTGRNMKERYWVGENKIYETWRKLEHDKNIENAKSKRKRNKETRKSQNDTAEYST